MSYYTEKTLSSIRSLVDEWSIRKEGGKQSFFVLKEIDKLLEDTPIDDVVSSKDVADKKNEVTMLRLERDEQLIRQQLDRAKQKSELTDTSALREANETIHNAQIYIDTLKAELSNSKSAIVMKNGVINEKNKTIDELTEQRDSEYETAKALRLVIDEIEQEVTKYKTTIDELNETISDLRMAASDMLDTINACARGEAEDSRVLMQVVSWVKQWDTTPPAYRSSHLDMRQIAIIVEDYLAAPETPVVTLKTPSMGTRVVSKNEDTHTIDEAKMMAVRMLVDSGDNWVVSTDMDAIEVMEQKETIDELKDFIRDQGGCVDDRDNRIEQLTVLNEALRVDIELAHNLSRDHIAGQDRIIEGLRSRMTGARVIIDNQATSIEELKSTVDFGQSRINLLVEKKSNCIGELMKDLDAKNTVIKDFKAIETKETDRLHTVIEGNGKIIDELNDMYCDACGKLERIEKIAGPSVRGRVCTRESVCRAINEIVAIVQKGNTIDEITKIIQEE